LEIAPQIGTIESNKAGFECESNKDWYKWAVSNIAPDDFEHGSKKRYSEKLEGILAQHAKQNEKLTASPATSIAARLNELKIWPEPLTHKKTTKKTTK
jgi:hypothetical protein